MVNKYMIDAQYHQPSEKYKTKPECTTITHLAEAKIKRTDHTKCWQGCGKTRTL